ncbi:hypothetical protein [Duganella levis]|uniref:WYL domain-containing protein n=1 Tax=Duganella levis TaxID=2692169 RepID=A0ABW9W9I0_9BURK|nr:hypothetical protein [Duganella levis]MYN30633.1 hypothetical protein [Duganella levis]
MEATVWYLLKIFDDERWADAFMRGELRLNRLRHFKKIEEKEYADDARPDEHEAASHWWQPDKVRIKLNIHGVGELDITDDLAGPVVTSYSHHENLHVLCLYAIRTFGISIQGETFLISDEDADRVREQLFVSEKVAKFGRHGVLIDAATFIEKMKIALRTRGVGFASNLVEYYDDETFNGEIKVDRIPFSKRKRFSFQNEYRFVVNTKTEGDDHLQLELGDISDFCRKVDPLELNNLFKFEKVEIPLPLN